MFLCCCMELYSINTAYRVFAQTILKRHVDSVVYDVSDQLETMCPPMICLRIQPIRGVPNLREEVFKLKVVGVEDVSFRIMTGTYGKIDCLHDSIDTPCVSRYDVSPKTPLLAYKERVHILQCANAL